MNTKLIVTLPTQEQLTLVVAEGFNVLTQVRGNGENLYLPPNHISNVVLVNPPEGSPLGTQIIADVELAALTDDAPSAEAADTVSAWCACVRCNATNVTSVVVMGVE